MMPVLAPACNENKTILKPYISGNRRYLRRSPAVQACEIRRSDCVPRLSLIIPAYNEEKRIKKTLEGFRDKLHASGIDFEIIVEMDGCTDGTLGIVEELAALHPEIRFVEFKRKLGKGGGILKGFEIARGKLVGFVDCDDSVQPEEFLKLLIEIEKGNDDVLIASRRAKGAIVKNQPVLRNILSGKFNLIARSLFTLPFKDTQCGAKIFRKDVLDKILPEMRTTGFAFDVNLLYLARRNGFKIREVGISWEYKDGSKVRISKAIAEMLYSLLRLRLYYSPLAFLAKYEAVKQSGAAKRIGFVSVYPPPSYKHIKTSGVASYTKNLIRSIDKNSANVEVFANKIPGIESKYAEDDIEVHRCWNMGLKYPYQIIRAIINGKKRFDMVHIQHEFFLYGGILSGSIFPVLLLFLRISRIPVVVTMHQVIRLSLLDAKFMKKNRIRGGRVILKLGLFLNTFLVAAIPQRIIVHEESFKNTLAREYYCDPDKITVIPHGVEEKKDLITRARARQLLNLNGEKVILHFGYLSGYKDIETLIDAFQSLDSGYKLIIAGGENPRLIKDASYNQYLSDLKRKGSRLRNVSFTGFVEEKEIPLYFSAADVVVFPYTMHMSSSGPMALAIAYGKPILLSKALIDNDSYENIAFETEPEKIATAIMRFFNNTSLQRCSREYVERLYSERNWRSIGEKLNVLYSCGGKSNGGHKKN